ncbi:MAG: 50S ribosomal protein L23 [Candidatus Paceibacterota bacterium]
MALTDIFKKESDANKTEPAAKKEKKAVASKRESDKTSRKISGAQGSVLLHAHVTEKASNSARDDQYIFRISKGANKNQITRAVEGLYGVDVVGVNVINIPSKRRRRGRGFATEPGYRKAVVRVKKGQSIEVMPK